MDIQSYLLGKNASGGGGDLSKYFNPTIGAGSSSNSSPTAIMNMIKMIPEDTTVSGNSLAYSFKYYQGETIPLLDTSNVIDMSGMFKECKNLTTIPLLDTSNVQYMGTMFSNCSNLTTIPVLNTSSAKNLGNIVAGCTKLTDTSLDNLLQMCIGAVVYTSVKTLNTIGLTSTYYPVSRIEALPHYQAFLDAGWTIGY